MFHQTTFLTYLITSLPIVITKKVCIENEAGNQCLNMCELEQQQWQLPYYEDSYGIQNDWLDPKNGWHQSKRLDWMIYRRSCSEQWAKVPRYTERGFKLLQIPPGLYQVIVEQSDQKFKAEGCVSNMAKVINCQTIDGQGYNQDRPVSFKADFLNLEVVHRMVAKYITPLMREWSGIEVDGMVVYGIRRYIHNAIILEHCDLKDTRVLGAILQVHTYISSIHTYS